MEEYSKAMSYLHKALAICQKALRTNHSDLAASYTCVRVTYYEMKEYSKAKLYFQ